MNSQTLPHTQGQTCVVLGAQWGDEGKGKIVDAISAEFDLVIRFQGGHNAGHTLKVGNQELVVHLVPSGILHANCHCCIGSGVVLSPQSLLQEITRLEQAGITRVRERLIIDLSTAIILPSHVALDKANEQRRGANKIGTTCLGIGPAYEDKTARRGLRLHDLLSPDMADKVARLVEYHNVILRHYYQAAPCCADAIVAELQPLLAPLREIAGRVTPLLLQAKDAGQRILFEGAQGVMLDLDQGTYPFVTSSSTLSSSLVPGSGFGFAEIDMVIGICKAYATRVGSGPFPSELHNKMGERLRTLGREFGATTGRPRRCGWLDAHALKRMVRINSVASLYVTKLDVFDSLEEIAVATSYKGQAESFDSPQLANQGVNYQRFPGWQTTTSGCTSYSQLPRAAMDYLDGLQSLIGCPIGAVSTGPERHAILYPHQA